MASFTQCDRCKTVMSSHGYCTVSDGRNTGVHRFDLCEQCVIKIGGVIRDGGDSK